MSVGELYDPLGAHLRDPYPVYDRARREEPVFYSPVMGAWVVTRYSDVADVLRDPVLYSSADPFTHAIPLREATLAELGRGYPVRPDLIQSDGELHARLRAPIAEVLKPDRVAALEPFVRAQAAELVDSFAADGRVEFMERYAVPLPCRTIGRLCGFDAAQARLAYESLDAFIVLGATHLEPERELDAARGWVELQELIGRLVRERRAEPGDDAISEVVAASVPGTGPLSYEDEAQVVANLIQLVIAGHITTVPLSGMAIAELLTHEDQWRRLCADPDLIPAAVEEILRYGTPASGLYRVTTAPTELGGVALPEGDRVLLRYTSANRDPARFERAAEFDVGRRPNRHLSFGRGTHFCVGAGLARMQMRVTLETLTSRLPGMRLAEPITYVPVLDLRRPEAVHLVW
ncbi:cytochrome P450 [Spongiactinospora sp. TRM90649]|uniref:cytochrome P450 n=1 Tax=Spongiactinospora sp. TRM90649 TaxID=3031114 RepID=UPI0023F8658F|nr:cytochrome P450 [Spongiactinospora sp. TRM90649]MDF5757061.1 cytochrome P450 [Spongiactinospora sp. TRM90649]